jgi:SPP1 gp7 family putative phage head morphogenesis protein
VQAPPSGSPPQPPPKQQQPAPKPKPRRKPTRKAAPARKPAAQQSPAPGQQPPPRQPPPKAPPPAVLAPATLIASIIAALSVALTAAALATALAKIMKAAGIGYLALRAVCILMMSWPESPLEGTGPAQRYMVRQNTLRRAQFMWSACKRVQAAVVDARSHGEPIRQTVRDALATERRYMTLHIHASTRRVTAATTVDGASEAYGPLLSWNAVMDSRTTAECRAADGKSFYAATPPAIGYPGTVHPHCRCTPGPPRAGAPILA